jgi:hypothetical protein
LVGCAEGVGEAEVADDVAETDAEVEPAGLHAAVDSTTRAQAAAKSIRGGRGTHSP